MSDDPIPDEVIEQAARAMERANRSSDPCDDWYVLLAEAAAPVLVAHGREQERQAARKLVEMWDGDDMEGFVSALSVYRAALEGDQ